jgi:hypothetical protein
MSRMSRMQLVQLSLLIVGQGLFPRFAEQMMAMFTVFAATVPTVLTPTVLATSLAFMHASTLFVILRVTLPLHGGVPVFVLALTMPLGEYAGSAS